jgi:predicted TIM-barrel fold metal-dependent hydrolase
LSTDKWGTLVPHVRWDDATAEEVWYFGDKKIYAAGLAAGARWHEYPPDHPRRITDADPRCYDARRRLEHMDDYGVLAQVLYPNIGVFQVNEYIGMKADPQLVLECVQAYNDFLVDFSSIAPNRYVPLMTVPFWNLEAAITELHRGHSIGHKGVVFPARMEDFNLPALSHPHWDPFWSEVQEMDLSINFHIGSGNIPMFGTDNSGKHLNYAWTGSMLFFLNANAITSLIFGGVCQRFPRLKFVSVESGVGWVPFLLEGMDWQFHNSGAHIEHPELELLPSEYFARQIYSCFWFERASARAAIEQLGADHVMFETDFPHSTGITPGPASAALAPRDHLRTALAGLPDDAIRKVLHDNAAELYRLEV